jgi:phosphate transport system substrate-binding protein
LTRIYLGKIKRWNDPQILNVNDGLAPKALDVPITPVFRSDGSGSTFVLTYYLAALSPEWQAGPGVGKEMKGVSGKAAKGTGGIVDVVEHTVGAIGYIDYGRAVPLVGAFLCRVTIVHPFPQRIGPP